MKEQTKILHPYNPKKSKLGELNAPVLHTSTVVFKDYAEITNPPKDKVIYGRHGLEPAGTFKKAMTALECGYDTILASSGCQAVIMSILANVNSGDHILVSDGSYGPTREAADGIFKNYGIETTYFDPSDLSNIDDLKKENTKLIFTETPSSITMEIGDIDSVIEFAKKHNIISIIDNTWSGGYFFKPLNIGFDVSVQAATKHIVGHSDALMGTIVVRGKDLFKKMNRRLKQFGLSVSPDDIYLALRGMKTLHVRINQHYKNASVVAKWLENHPLVDEVFYATLENSPGHSQWKKHFTGACGLLAFTFKENYSDNHIGKFADSLKYFYMGYSWGGFESLITFNNPVRTANPWNKDRVIRLHIGLEDVDDIIEDLDTAIKKL